MTAATAWANLGWTLSKRFCELALTLPADRAALVTGSEPASLGAPPPMSNAARVFGPTLAINSQTFRSLKGAHGFFSAGAKIPIDAIWIETQIAQSLLQGLNVRI